MLTVTSGISGMLPRLSAAPAAAASDLAEALHDAAERAREEGGPQGRTHAQTVACSFSGSNYSIVANSSIIKFFHHNEEYCHK